MKLYGFSITERSLVHNLHYACEGGDLMSVFDSTAVWWHYRSVRGITNNREEAIKICLITDPYGNTRHHIPLGRPLKKDMAKLNVMLEQE